MWYRFCKDVELEENNIPYKSWEDFEQEAKLKSQKEMSKFFAQQNYEQLVEKDRAFLYQIWEKYKNDPEIGLKVLVENLRGYRDYEPHGPDMKGYYEGHRDFYNKYVCTDIGTKEAYELIDILRSLIPIDLEKEAKKPQIDSEYVMPSAYSNGHAHVELSDFKNLIYFTILKTPLPKIPQMYNNIKELDAAKIDELEYEVMKLYEEQLLESLRISYNKIYNYFKDIEFKESGKYNNVENERFRRRQMIAVWDAYDKLDSPSFLLRGRDALRDYKRYFNLTTIPGLKEFNKAVAEDVSDRFVELMIHFFNEE